MSAPQWFDLPPELQGPPEWPSRKERLWPHRTWRAGGPVVDGEVITVRRHRRRPAWVHRVPRILVFAVAWAMAYLSGFALAYRGVLVVVASFVLAAVSGGLFGILTERQ